MTEIQARWIAGRVLGATVIYSIINGYNLRVHVPRHPSAWMNVGSFGIYIRTGRRSVYAPNLTAVLDSINSALADARAAGILPSGEHKGE